MAPIRMDTPLPARLAHSRHMHHGQLHPNCACLACLPRHKAGRGTACGAHLEGAGRVVGRLHVVVLAHILGVALRRRRGGWMGVVTSGCYSSGREGLLLKHATAREAAAPKKCHEREPPMPVC